MRAKVLISLVMLCGCDRIAPTPPELMADVTGDVTAPTLAAFDFSPKSFNASDGSTSVTVNFKVTDDISGATEFDVFIHEPGGNSELVGTSGFSAATEYSGTLTIDFPQYSQPGTWTVEHVFLRDASGNYRFLFTEDLNGFGFPTSLSVSSNFQDTIPPTLEAFDFTPRTVNIADRAADVTVNFKVADDVSGAIEVGVFFRDPTNFAVLGRSTFAPATRLIGSLVAEIPKDGVPGTWTVQSVYLRDANGNIRWQSDADLSAKGFPISLTVIKDVPVLIDIQPGDGLNTIKLSKQGKVTVAILSDAGFDAPSRVVRSSLTFGHTGDEPSLASCAKEGEDVNGDGFRDLVCQFYVQRSGFQVGDTQGTLRGRMIDQVPIEGKDAVRVLK